MSEPAIPPGAEDWIRSLESGMEELASDAVPVPCIRQVFSLLAVTRELLPRVTCPSLVFQSLE